MMRWLGRRETFGALEPLYLASISNGEAVTSKQWRKNQTANKQATGHKVVLSSMSSTAGTAVSC